MKRALIIFYIVFIYIPICNSQTIKSITITQSGWCADTSSHKFDYRVYFDHDSIHHERTGEKESKPINVTYATASLPDSTLFNLLNTPLSEYKALIESGGLKQEGSVTCLNDFSLSIVANPAYAGEIKNCYKSLPEDGDLQYELSKILEYPDLMRP